MQEYGAPQPDLNHDVKYIYNQPIHINIAEAPNKFWRGVFQNFFGGLAIVISFGTWYFFVVWLELDALGGFGPESGDSQAYFNWHPMMMATGFLLFMVPGILSFEVFPCRRNTNKYFHLVFNTLGTFCISAGLFVTIDAHSGLVTELADEDIDVPNGHFSTLHSLLGLLTVVILGCNYFGGFAMYFLNLGGDLRVALKPTHKRFGFLAVLLGLITICVGMQEWSKLLSLSGDAKDFCVALTMMTFFVIICMIFSLTKFMDKVDPDAPGLQLFDDGEQYRNFLQGIYRPVSPRSPRAQAALGMSPRAANGNGGQQFSFGGAQNGAYGSNEQSSLINRNGPNGGGGGGGSRPGTAKSKKKIVVSGPAGNNKGKNSNDENEEKDNDNQGFQAPKLNTTVPATADFMAGGGDDDDDDDADV